MKSIFKYTNKFIYQLVWFMFVFCIYIVIAYYAESLRIPAIFNSQVCEKVNNIAFALSISYTAGVFVFILTVLLPERRKRKVMLAIVAEDLRYLKDEMYELFVNICGKNCLGRDEVSVNSIIKEIITDKEREKLEAIVPIEIPMDTVNFFKDKVRIFESYLQSIISFNSYLSPEENKEIGEIRSSKFFSQVKHHFSTNNKTYYNITNLKSFVDSMIETNQKVVNLYGKLKKYSS